jgi:hypothetical protein
LPPAEESLSKVVVPVAPTPSMDALAAAIFASKSEVEAVRTATLGGRSPI